MSVWASEINELLVSLANMTNGTVPIAARSRNAHLRALTIDVSLSVETVQCSNKPSSITQ